MKKTQILEKTHDFFYQYGFHACGVELLASQAGTTKRTLYAHFGSKEGLIIATLNYRHQWFMERLQQSLDNLQTDSLIEGYLQFLQGWIQSDNFYGCMFINACGEFSDKKSAPHKVSQEHKQTVRDYLQKKLADDNVVDLLFLYGEGLIVNSQIQGGLVSTNLNDFIDFLKNLRLKSEVQRF